MYIYMCVCIYIYIYIRVEHARARVAERVSQHANSPLREVIYMQLYICVYYIYIYRNMPTAHCVRSRGFNM